MYVHQFGAGTYAQFTVCNQENVHQLHPMLTFKQGAALGVPYLTAYRALFHKYVILRGCLFGVEEAKFHTC